MAISKLTNVSAKKLDETGKISGEGCEIYGITLSAGSQAEATVIIDNSTDGSGDEVWKLSAVAGGSESIAFPHPILCGSGAYATLSGTGAQVSVAYE